MYGGSYFMETNEWIVCGRENKKSHKQKKQL